MEIRQAIIHKITKLKDTSGSESVDNVLRPTAMTLDGRLNKLGDSVLTLYGRLSNGYGTLGNERRHRFTQKLNDFTNQTIDFYDFARSTTEIISEEMSRKTKTTTSFPIFLEYDNQGRRWLLIALLKLEEGVSIDENLNLTDSLNFNVKNLREAARIDIEKWRNDEQPYLSFIKKGSGDDASSSKYFIDALSCLGYTDSKHHSKLTLDAIEEYCKAKEYDAAKRQEKNAHIYDYFKEQDESNQEVSLVSLSAIVDHHEPEAFHQFVRDSNYQIDDVFAPHKGTYNKNRVVKGKFGTISVAFEVGDLQSGVVQYCEEDGTLVISNPSEKIIADMRKAAGED